MKKTEKIKNIYKSNLYSIKRLYKKLYLNVDDKTINDDIIQKNLTIFKQNGIVYIIYFHNQKNAILNTKTHRIKTNFIKIRR